MPTNTDLVTDLPADFEVFGQAVDTTMADLKGGTSGQVLAKASATDMDFTWTTPEIGDITAITVTAPITGGGTTGSVGIGIQAASTTQTGAVQLTDSTSSTSTTTAATPNSVKTSYDLANTANTTANAAIAKTTVTTAGDIIYRNSTVPTRLGIGTAGQVLAVNSGATAPEWKTISTASGMTLIKTVNYTSASSTGTDFNSQFNTTYKFYELRVKLTHSAGAVNLNFQFSNGSTTKTSNYYGSYAAFESTYTCSTVGNVSSCKINYIHTTQNQNVISITGVGSAQKPVFSGIGYSGQSSVPVIYGYQIDETATNYDGFVISPASGTFTGTVSLYGMAAS